MDDCFVDPKTNLLLFAAVHHGHRAFVWASTASARSQDGSAATSTRPASLAPRRIGLAARVRSCLFVAHRLAAFACIARAKCPSGRILGPVSPSPRRVFWSIPSLPL